MTNRSSRGSDEPEKAVALRRSINDRELIRELHQGQRSCGPHTKAGHMAAPDQSVKTPKALLPRRRRPHTALRANVTLAVVKGSAAGEAPPSALLAAPAS